MRLPSRQIEAVLGYVDEPELIHRDNPVYSNHESPDGLAARALHVIPLA